MPKRNFNTLEDFKANLHKEGATLVEMSGKKIPCLLINRNDYDEIMAKLYGKTVRAEPMLDIFYDGKDVFVDVEIKFADTDFDKNYLLYANGMLEFFEALADSSLIAISPGSQAQADSQSIFMIQLARNVGAEKALQIIQENAGRRPPSN